MIENNNFKKEIFLTFDDGPSEKFTPKILETLKEKNIKATFFVCGKNVQRCPEVLKETVKEGHKIGIHSFSHKRSFLINYKKEIEKTEEIIFKTVGIKTNLFRAPWGICPFYIKKYLREKNYLEIFWTIDSKDWKGWEAKKIVKNVIKKINSSQREREIILLHDGQECDINFDRSQTVFALKDLIEEFLKRGYSFSSF